MSHGSHSHGGMEEHATTMTNASTAMMNESMDHPLSGDTHLGGHGGAAGHAITFHLKTDLNLLFEPWDISTTKALVGSCIAFLLLSALYEGLKMFRVKLITMHLRKERELGKEDALYITKRQQGCRQICSFLHLTQTAIHIVQVALGYLLMLVVMTYQVYLGIAVILGAGLGYFLFAGLMSEGVQGKPKSCPNSTEENSAIDLGVTSFNENRGGPRIEQRSSCLAIANKGFGNG